MGPPVDRTSLDGGTSEPPSFNGPIKAEKPILQERSHFYGSPKPSREPLAINISLLGLGIIIILRFLYYYNDMGSKIQMILFVHKSDLRPFTYPFLPRVSV